MDCRVAAATSQPWLSGVNLKTTLYGFDNNGVNETEANVIFNNSFSFNQQGLLATDGSWQSTSTFNMSLPDGYGSLWGRASMVLSVTRYPCSRTTTLP